ncbi:isoprenoid synthase domain-containing protein [Aspergillus karnatakaensis]|uniref:terpene synthase family protein n=1 Tax=Aspergillus karnatakaensis TaxID=1810916 RepID=UPI003CCD5D23
MCIPSIAWNQSSAIKLETLNSTMTTSSTATSATSAALKLSLPHQDFCRTLRGEQATIPNLNELFTEWEPRFHPDWQKAREEVLDPWLQRWVDEQRTCAKLQAANFTRFAAIVCADAPFERLCTVAKYFAWLNEKIRQDVCEILLATMLPFVDSVDTVDSIYAQDTVPTIAQYWHRRDLTAAVYPVIATLFFIHNATTSVSNLRNPDLAKLWKHTSYIVHITNDILSMPKEARDGQIEGLVPVLMMNYGLDCATAIEWSVQLAKDEARGIRAVEKQLLHEESKNDGVRKLLADVFIDGCKDVAMGLINWSYHGERYFRKEEIQDDYTIKFEL